MKRAPVMEAPMVKPKKAPRVPRPDKPCVIEGCGKIIPRNCNKYCSKVCRNLGMSKAPIHLGLPGGGWEQTEYRVEFSGQIFDDFIDWCDTSSEPTLIPTESSYIIIYNAKIPTAELFAEYLWKQKHVTWRIAGRLLTEWGVAHIEFAHTLDIMHEIQKTRLMNNGAANRYTPQIAKMLLSVNHGMHEKTEVDNTHKMIGVVKQVYQKADELERKYHEERNKQRQLDAGPQQGA